MVRIALPLLLAIAACAEGQLPSRDAKDPRNPNAPEGAIVSPSGDAPRVADDGGVYACPMHPEVTSDKPGKCPKCGMTLVKTKMYSCPMHPEVVSSKPGKCPKCGMDL